MFMQTYLSKVVSFLSLDVIVLLVILLAIFFYILYFGRNRVISLIFAYYPAVMLYKAFPFTDRLLLLKGEKMLVLNHLLIFLVFLIPISIILGKYVFTESGYSGTTHIFRNIGLALCGLLLVLIFTQSVVNFDSFYHFSPTIETLFSTPTRLFWWNIAPFVLLAFV